MRETDIVQAVIKHYHNDLPIIATEVPFLQRRIDLVLFLPLSNHLIAVEAKITDWKKAIDQSISCSLFADEVYIAMPEQFVHRVDKSMITNFGIGLLSVNSSVKFYIKPSKPGKPMDIYHDRITNRMTKNYREKLEKAR